MSRPRHVPMRRCVVCRAARPKQELIRLVRGADGWVLDLRQRAGGRGTSICPACALAAVRRSDAASQKAVRRAFRQETDAVATALSVIESTLAAAASAAATADPASSAAAPTPTERPRPNGGMHG
jgi:uncharacterized protein